MDIRTAKALLNTEETDYQSLLNILKHYARPREKISSWLKSGDLVRVKKGLYVFGPHIAQSRYSLEILANLIYGPSAISLNYALSFYGLIPEKVTTITSITNKRNKSFSTPVGEFTYQYMNHAKYPIGIELLTQINGRHFLIASPEKALCDYISLIDKKIVAGNIDEMHKYLLLDLRLDETGLRQMRLSRLTDINAAYQDPRLTQLIYFLKKW